MWKLLLINSPRLHGLATNSFSPHLAIQFDIDYSEREHYYLYSPHLETLDYEVEDDKQEAYYKSKVLLLILNTALKLVDIDFSIHSHELVYTLPNDTNQVVSIRELDPMVHIEQLQNPYSQAAELATLTKTNRLGQILDLTYADELFREVIILYGLALNDYLYLLVNMYKINENIEHDLKNLSDTITQRSINVDSLEDALQPFRKGDFRHFANTRAGSGLQSRHGANKNVYNKSKPTFEEIKEKLKKMINEWIDVKLQV